MENKTDRLTVLIDPRKKKIFEEICLAHDLTPSQVVRQLIREYIIAHADKPLPAWLTGTAVNTRRTGVVKDTAELP